MRRIKSEKEIQARRKKIQLLVGIFMVGLMVFATAGYFASELFAGDSTLQGGSIQYGGRTYFRQGEFWILQEQQKNFYFYNLPNESREIYLNESNFMDYSGKVLYIVNLAPEAQFLISNLEGVYSRWQPACIDLENCDENLPIKDCSDNLIIFNKNENTKVERQENCIFIYGDYEKGVDAFSYNLLKIR